MSGDGPSGLFILAARAGIVVGLQATAQILSERLWREKVALIRYQTIGCSVWGEQGQGAEGDGLDVADSGAEASERDEEWNEDELTFVASTSGIFAMSVCPLLTAVVQQMVYVHCPRVSFALPFLLHPIRVASTRLCCPGWCEMSHWQCMEVTLKGLAGTSCGAGIIPWAISYSGTVLFRALRFETRIRGMLRRWRLRRRSALSTYNNHSEWTWEQFERLGAGLASALAGAALVYPLAVLEKRLMCDMNAPHPLALVATGRYAWDLVKREGFFGMYKGYALHALIELPKYCLRFTARINEEIHARWFGAYTACAIPISASGVASYLRSRSCGLGLWEAAPLVLSDMLGRAWEVLTREMGGTGMGTGGTRDNGGRGSSSLPLVSFRSEDSRAMWFRAAYGMPPEDLVHDLAEAPRHDRLNHVRWEFIRGPNFSSLLPLCLSIDPNNVLLSSFHLLEGAPPELFRQRPLYVRFNGQVGSDWGGIRRAWIAKLSQELFDPRLGLVLPVFSQSGVPTGRLIINPVPYSSLDGSLTGLHEEELTRRYYRFMGRVIGIALIQGDTLAARMTSAFYKVLRFKVGLRVVMLGPPCSGKTTHCKMLADKLRIRHVTVERVVSRHVAKGTPQGKAARRFVRGAMQPGARNNTEGVTESLLGMLFATPASEQGDTSTAEGTEDVAAQLQKAAEQLVIAMLNQYLGKQRNKGWVLEGIPHTSRMSKSLLSSSMTRPDCCISLCLTDNELYANIIHSLSRLQPATHPRLRQRIVHYLVNGESCLGALRGGGIPCHVVASEEAQVLGLQRQGWQEHSLIHRILSDSYLWEGGRLVEEGATIDDGDRAGREQVSQMHVDVSAAIDSVLWLGGEGVANLDDLEQADPCEASKLRALREMSEEELDEWLSHGDLSFRTTTGEASVAPLIGVPLTKVTQVESELLGGHGPDDRVTRSTLGEYIDLVCSKKMVTDVLEQMCHVQKGLLEVVPAAFIKSLSASDIEAALCGEATIDADEWRSCSVEKGFSPDAPQIEWFWELVGEMQDTERLQLFEWTTGMACPPSGGLGQLPTAFTIQCDPDPQHSERLPCCHACGFQLDLPLYRSKQVLSDKLRQAMVEGADFQLV